MNQFYEVTIKSIEILKTKKIEPPEAWNEACDELKLAESVKGKPCPRATFLCLFQEKLIINLDNYNIQGYFEPTKSYTLKAIELLKQNGKNKYVSGLQLWKDVMRAFKDNRSHNQEIDVLFALWDLEIIKS
jgi:hypothetical protein